MRRLARMILALTLGAILSVADAHAHEVRPATADAEISPSEVLLQYRLMVEPILAGINLAGLSDTNESPLSGLSDQLRALPGSAIADRVRSAWPMLSNDFIVISDGNRLSLDIVSITVPDGGDLSLPRQSRLILRATLPPGDAPVQIGWAERFGPLILRQDGGGEDLYAAYLQGGELSDPLPRDGVAAETSRQVFARFILLGVEHIVPKGFDHILFVLGLFFFSTKLRPLFLQISTFTVAHTVTLALASVGVISVPATIVEPLIAASITVVALENLRGNRVGWGRLAVVFGFGLLHGLGFASVLSELELPRAQFITGLIAFNIGVEIGQLAIITFAWALLAQPFGQRIWYRRRIALPGSVAIAAIGAWWMVERVVL